MKRIWVLALICLASRWGWGTHNYGGEIIYNHVDTINGQPNSAPTYWFGVITYTQMDNPACRDSFHLEVRYGANNVVVATFMAYLDGPPENLGNGISKNTYHPRQLYTFPSAGRYVAGVLDPNRVDGVQNISGSVSVPFYIETVLDIKPWIGYNATPTFHTSGVIFCKPLDTLFHQMTWDETDGDSLVFSLTTPLANVETYVPGYNFPDDVKFELAQPNTLSIHPETGLITWALAQAQGMYSLAVLVEEYRHGVRLGAVLRDMMIVNDPDFTGGDEQAPGELVVYPNPTLGTVTIPHNGQVIELIVSDLQGREVVRYSRHNPGDQIDLSGEAPGIYVIRALDNAGNVVAKNKIVKQ
jgi:hypothetical protein